MIDQDLENPFVEEAEELDTPLAWLGFQVLKLSLALVTVIYLHGHFLVQGGGQWAITRQWVMWTLEGIAIIGLIFALVGWMQSPYAHTRIRYYEVNDTPVLRMVGVGFSLILIASAADLILYAPGPMNPGRIVATAVLLCWGGGIAFLSTFFVPERHRAVTTFMNVFTPFFAFALIPLLWPLLVAMTIFQPEDDACDLTSGFSTEVDEVEEWEVMGARQ